MAASVESLLGHLHRWLASTSAEIVSDAVLLERFACRGDDSAFAALLARHGPMVHGVCRRVLHDPHEAEDAFQATFLVLARKAGMLRRPHALAGWLYGTARHLALKRRRDDARRRRRETDSLRPSPSFVDPLDQLAARELLLILDEELERLPQRYRLPLLLCGVEGRPQEEAARILGCTPGSLRGRLERGRKRLQACLSRRGLAFSGAMLALSVSQAGSLIVTPGLTSMTLQAALAFARGERDHIAANVLVLVESGVEGMVLTKASWGLIPLLLMGLVAGTGLLAHPLLSENQPASPPAARAELPKPEMPKPERTDRFGDPLPAGALTRLGSTRLRHGGTVMSVAFARDGKSVISSGSDGCAFQWDVHSGKCLRVFRCDSIHSVALDPAGKRLALADFSGQLRLYELATGKELASCSGHPGGASVAVFSPDGKRLASVGKDKRIRVWDAATSKEIRSWQDGRENVFRLRFSPDGKSLATLSLPAAPVRLWDVSTGAERPLQEPLANLQLRDFCFTPDGKGLFTGSYDQPGLLQLWDLSTAKEVRTIARVEWGIAHIVLAPDGKSIWSAGWNDGPRQWDLATGKQILHLPHPSYIRVIMDLALSPDGKHLATGAWSHDVFLWDTVTGRRLLDTVGHHCLTTAAFFTPDGRQLWTGGSDRTIRLWSAASGEQLRCLALDDEVVFSHALRPDGKMLAAGVVREKFAQNPQGAIRLWDLTTGTQRESLHGHIGLPVAVAFSPDGRLLASRGRDQTIRLWDVAAGKERWLGRCQESGATGIVFSPDGLHVIAGLDKETVGFWDVATGRLTRRLSVGPSGGMYIPLLSRDGRMLVTGGGAGQPLRLWEVASAKERYRVERPSARQYVTAALSPDGRILAWFDYGRPIQLWDLIADRPLGELGEPTTTDLSPLSLTFSADSRRLVSTHADGTALLWDVARLWPKAATPATLSAKRLEELWNELAAADATRAYRAVRALAAGPEQAVPLLRDRLARSASTDTAKITRLLADLDSEQFELRERASRGLQGLGMQAAPAMRRALGNEPSLEARRRLEKVLERLESAERTAEELRLVRAVEVLELVGSAEARQVLRELARGPADAWLTREAGSVLARLAERPDLKP